MVTSAGLVEPAIRVIDREVPASPMSLNLHIYAGASATSGARGASGSIAVRRIADAHGAEVGV